MFNFSRRKQKPQQSYSQSQSPAAPKVTATYISATTELQGTMHVDGNLQVDGIVHGGVHVSNDVVIAQSGLVEGPELRGHNIIIHGVVKAKIYAAGQLTLKSTARLEGDVTASALNMEAGAFYVGYIATTESKGLPGSDPLPELMGRGNEYEGQLQPNADYAPDSYGRQF